MISTKSNWFFFKNSQLIRNLFINYLHTSPITQKVVRFNLADIGEGISEVQIKEWHIKVGDLVKEFDEICLVQSDKASVTITSRYTGTITNIYYSIDDIAKVGQPLLDIDVPSANNGIHSYAPSKSTQSEHEEHTYGLIDSRDPTKIIATPAVRRIIQESKLDPTSIQGSGKNGRVLKEDVLSVLGKRSGEFLTKKEDPLNQTSTMTTVRPIRGYTRTMIKTMTEALKIPHFGYNDEYFVDKLMRLRDTLNCSSGSEPRQKMSYFPIIIKATSIALSEFPVLNSRISNSMDELILFKNHNISIAMDTPEGLIVPNIKSCQAKTIWEISTDLNRLSTSARNSGISEDDLRDGTFSLSNIGAMGGGTYMNPIIFPPQVAIGAIGKIRKVPRFEESEDSDDEHVISAHIMQFSWAADHRVIDGATLARFSNRLKQLIEQPSIMLGQMT